MSNVIKVNFKNQDDNTGYYTVDDEIMGVYVKDLGAVLDDGTVYVGEKYGNGILRAITMTKCEMTEFCRMWLDLHDPDIKEVRS